MKFLSKSKDGGPQSTVTGYWLAEIKSLFSIVLLRFDEGSRDQYHSHAFSSLNWVLRGRVVEQHVQGGTEEHTPSLRPVLTHRHTYHRVVSTRTTWVLSLRGPWSRTWREFDPRTKRETTLTHGRVEVK